MVTGSTHIQSTVQPPLLERLLIKGTSEEQRLLPPIAPLIRRRVPHRRESRDIQFQDRRVISISLKQRQHAHPVRVPAFRKRCDVPLQRLRDRRARDARVWAVVVGVRHVQAVQRRRDGEVVAVGVVAVGFAEVEGVARQHRFGDQGRGAGDLVRVRLGLAAVEDGRVECVGDVV